MKRFFPLIFLAVLITFVSCEEENVNNNTTNTNNSNTETEPDNSLAGGKWYRLRYRIRDEFNPLFYEKDESKGSFEFIAYEGRAPNLSFTARNSSDFLGIYGVSFYNCEVYPNEGILYRVNYNTKIIKYEFTNIWPFPDTENYNVPIEMREQYDQLAAAGNLIRYSLYNPDGTLYDDGRNYSGWVLMRSIDEE